MVTRVQDKTPSRTRSRSKSQTGNPSAAGRPAINRIGIWIEGFDRLGAQYEGIWRVIKNFILSSEESGISFCFVAAARFEKEIALFLEDLPDSLQEQVRIEPVGAVDDKHSKNEAVRQAVFANQLELDAWLVPNPMWGAAKHLTRPKVVWFHDFLLAEFPQSYPRDMFVEFQRKVRDLKASGAFFTFASPHVQKKHGYEACGIGPDESMLVVTPSMDASSTLADLPSDPKHGGDIIRAELRKNLKTWCTPAHADLFFHHISSYPFESVPYFFVSSQNRAHKNFLRLAQIHAAMIRERYLHYPVFTTALIDVLGQSPLENFLNKELHMGDFMSVGKVSEVTHSLLYKFARLTIHPSTFEGNLPFTFGESVSVGTPCILPYSRAYLHRVEPSMYPWIFYSPTEPGLIGKIQEIEENRDEFLAAQQQIWASMHTLDLKDYFNKQMQAFAKSAQIEPKAFHYVFEEEYPDEPEHRRRSIKDIFRSLAGQTEASSEEAEPLLQARTWPRFDLARSKNATDKDVVMHWAHYLDDHQPKEASYYVMCIRGLSAAVDGGDVKFGAEIGTWINDEYVVADRGVFSFMPLKDMPANIRNGFGSDEVRDSFCGPDDRLGWIKLGWKEGVVPELRISGTPLPSDCEGSASIACLSKAPSAFERPVGSVGNAN